jgi:hypothetical protein
MAGTIYNNLKEEKQRDWYRKIVDFGNDKRVPLNEINVVLLLGNLESRGYQEKIPSGTGGSGLFQYMGGTWYDLTNSKSQFKMYKDARNQLAAWKYDLTNRDPNLPQKLNMKNPQDHIAVMYAELAGFTKEFNSATQPGGKRDTEHYRKAWEAFDKACKGLGKECPTDPYERYVLFIQAAHHGPSQIQEVVTGWQKKILPNIKDNLEFLKSKRKEWNLKVSQDDTEAATDEVAEATERDSGRTAPAAQTDDAYSTEDRKKKDLAAGDDAEDETARRGDDSGEREAYDSMNKQGGIPATASNGSSLGMPEAPWRHALDALGVASSEIHLTPAVDYGNIKPDSFDMVDKGTSETIGSCVMTPTGCEMTAGDRKVVMDKISGNDVSVETYAQNDEGDLKLQKTVRIGDNDGITVTRPWTGLA